MSISFQELKNVVEAAILTSEVPISIRQIQSIFPVDDCPDNLTVERVLLELQRDCDERGIELKKLGRWLSLSVPPRVRSMALQAV